MCDPEFTQEGTGAVERTMTPKLQESVSILDFIPVEFHADIRAGTSTEDCHPYIMAAIDSRTYGHWDHPVYVSGPAIYFPPGIYPCGSTIQLKKSVRLFGDGSGMPLTSTARLKFPAGVTGIVVNRSDTEGDAVNPTPGTGADGTIIEGLQIAGTPTGATAHGIWLLARALIRNCYVLGFNGNGVQVDTAASTPPGNANNFRIESGRFSSNVGNGLYVNGDDANAGYVIGLDSSHNGGYGIYDSSYLGNTYVACHTEANALAYKSDNANARKVFIGCYSEPGQAPSEIAFPSMVVGGQHGAGTSGDFVNLISHPDRLYSGTTTSTAIGDMTSGILVGAVPGDSTLLSFGATDDPYAQFRLKSELGQFRLDWANIANVLAFYKKSATIANGFPRDMTAVQFNGGGIGFQNGYFFGPGMLYRGVHSGPPVATWEAVVGDIIYNNAPTSSGYIGWVCTVAGNPGTWKGFGLIA